MQIIAIVFLFLFAVQCNCICQCVSYYGTSSRTEYMHGCDDFESQALCFRAEQSFKKAGEDLLFSVLENSNVTDTDFMIQFEKFEKLLRQSIPPHDCFGALRTVTRWRGDTTGLVNVLCQSSKLVEECERMKNSAKEWSVTVLDLSKSLFSPEKQAQLRNILQKQDAISIDCPPDTMDANEGAPKSPLSAFVVCFVAIAETVYKL